MSAEQHAEHEAGGGPQPKPWHLRRHGKHEIFGIDQKIKGGIGAGTIQRLPFLDGYRRIACEYGDKSAHFTRPGWV